MLHLDIVVLVCDYLNDSNNYYLNKCIYQNVQENEQGLYWKQRYESFFININKTHLILKWDYNWKKEFMRVRKINKWMVIKNVEEFELRYLKVKKICRRC